MFKNILISLLLGVLILSTIEQANERVMVFDKRVQDKGPIHGKCLDLSPNAEACATSSFVHPRGLFNGYGQTPGKE